MEPERSSPTVAGPVLQSTLNGVLREVVQNLLEKAPHANFFRNPVSCVVVEDYRDYVPADQEICLSQILERTKAQYYPDAAAFRADLQLIYKNAAAYNGREGGKHAYEPVIHWAADILASADMALHQWIPEEPANAGEQELPPNAPNVPNVPIADAVCNANIASAALVSINAVAAVTVAAAAATQRPSDSPITVSFSPIEQKDVSKPSILLQQQAMPKSEHAQQPDQQPQMDQRQHDQKQEQVQEQPQIAHQRISAAGNGQSSPRIANGSSAGQQSSSPSSGSGAGSHSGLEALLAACELAAEQDSAPPHVGGPASAPGGGTASVDAAPERRSFPGCGGQSKPSQQLQQQEPPQQQRLALEDGEMAHEPSSEQGPASTGKGQQQQQQEDPAASSEGAGMALCCVRSGGSSGGPEGTVTAAQAGGSGGGGGVGGASGSYLASNAFKNRRHKSKVYIKPNKVVYLPTTFVEEEFDVTALPLDCELRVEADGMLTDESFRVTIKAVPRQGLSTMYCMTNVMRFQQQYLNWQIYNWTRIDNSHIKIHLQSPSPSQTQLQRIDLDRSASMPEVGRNFASRASEDGAFGYQSRGGSAATAASLKRKSDTGRYNVTRVERRLVPEPGRELLPLELRLSSTGYTQYPSPIPESPPASPQRRVSTACTTSAAAAVGMGPAALPPRAPATHGPLPTRLPATQQFSLQPQQPHHQQQPHIHQQQIQIHHHHHYQGGHYQSQSTQQLYHSGHQQHPHSHSHPHPHTPQHGGIGGSALALPYSLSQMQAQAQRASNSSIMTKHEQQTCSEDSSGPVPGTDAAAAAPLQLAWHQAVAGGGAAGVYRSTRLPTGSTASRTASVLHQLEVQELAEQLQLQAQASGTELSALAAVQLAVVALQQQQQQSSLMTATLPRGSIDGGVGGVSSAPLELANAVDQERLLQQLGLGAGITMGHTQTRGSRCGTGGNVFLHAASGRRESVEGGGLDADFGSGQRGPVNSGALDVYMQQHPASSKLYHEEHHQHQQQRRSSQGERSRHVSASPVCKASQQHTTDNDEIAASQDTVTMADSAAYASAAVQSGKQLGGGMKVDDVEGQQHMISYPRHSGTGSGLHVVGGGAGPANKMYPSGVGSLMAGGRIRFEVGPAAGGGTLVMGPRISGSGRRLTPASMEHLAKAAGVGLVAAPFPGGIELADCTAADLLSLLSPSKRFKVAVTTDNTGPAAPASVGGGGGDLPVLDMLNGLRAAAAAAGSRSLPTEAALTALRLAGGGSQAAAALGSRSFLPVGPEILGQLM